MPLRVMSFNIRFSGGKDGINAWVNRRSAVSALVKKYHPDIVGFQETMQDQFLALKEDLFEYRILGDGGDYLPKQKERLPIFYLPHLTLEKQAQGVFWMSNTPDRPTYRWWGKHPRICVWGHFLDTRTHQIIAIYHTHYDHRWERHRKRMAQLTIQRMQNQSHGVPRILFGDFNATPNSPSYNIIRKELRDIFADGPSPRATNSVSFHDFTGRMTASGKKGLNEWVDYIWISRDLKPISNYLITDRPEKDSSSAEYISDHWILMSDIEFLKPY